MTVRRTTLITDKDPAQLVFELAQALGAVVPLELAWPLVKELAQALADCSARPSARPAAASESTPMTHDELVERVARAIAETGVKLIREGNCDPKVVTEEQAKAALEASNVEQMREEIAGLRTALRFYEREWVESDERKCFEKRPSIEMLCDAGDRARTALNRTLPPIAETKE